jgi:hypothetical protein
MAKLFLAGFGFSLAFILCGLIGASAIVAGVPALREKCDEGVVCYALQMLRVIPLPRHTVVDPNPRSDAAVAPQSRCLTVTDRAVLYQLGMTLIGSPVADGTEVPTALGLGQADCTPIEDAAKKLSASLGQEWSMGRPVNCEFRSKQASQLK